MNNKSLSERLNTIKDMGPDKWLSRNLSESAEEKRRTDNEAIKKAIKKIASTIPKTDKNTKPSNVRSYYQRAFDNVVEPLPDEKGKATKTAKNLGFKVGKKGIYEPDFDTPRHQYDQQLSGTVDNPEYTDQNKDPFHKDSKSSTYGREDKPGFKLDLDVNPQGIKDRQAERLAKREAEKAKEDKGIPLATSMPDGRFTGNQVNSGGKSERLDAAGNSETKLRGENATIEAISAMYHDGLEGDELMERVARHFQYKKTKNGAQNDPYTDKERADKVEGAIRAAEAIIQHFDNGLGNPILLGKRGGQHSDVDDVNRTNIYDDIMAQLYRTIGQRMYKKEGRETSVDKNFIKRGKEEITNDVVGGGSTGELDAVLSPADIFLLNESHEGDIRSKFDELAKLYSDDEEDLIGAEGYTQMVGETLAALARDRQLMGYSLKDIVSGKPIHTQETNLHPDKIIKVLNAVTNGDIDLNTNVESKVTKSGKNKGQTQPLRLKRNLNFEFLMKILNESDESEDEFPGTFASSTATRPSMFKIEPFGFGAKLGIMPSQLAKQLIQDYTDEDIHHNTNYRHPDGKSLGSDYAAIRNAPNFSDDQMNYWGDYVDELINNPSDRFNIGSTPFVHDGEEMSGRDWITRQLQNFNMTDQENLGPGIVQREGKPYDRTHSRFDTLSLLRNLRMFKALRNADKAGADEFTEMMRRMIGGAGKINTDIEDFHFPFTKIASQIESKDAKMDEED